MVASMCIPARRVRIQKVEGISVAVGVFPSNDDNELLFFNKIALVYMYGDEYKQLHSSKYISRNQNMTKQRLSNKIGWGLRSPRKEEF